MVGLNLLKEMKAEKANKIKWEKNILKNDI
jgi:hypothetical protein